MKTVDQLTHNELSGAVKALLQFYEFTMFQEREVSECVGLTFAIEMLMCSLQLDLRGDTADTASEFISALDIEARADAADLKKWMLIREYLPYLSPVEGMADVMG